MKKILKPGGIPKFVTTCPCCNCEFEYTRQDIVTGKPDPFILFVSCPLCNTYIRHEGRNKCSMDKTSTMQT